MGQRDVFEFLKQHKGCWFCAKELSEKLGITVGAVTASLRKLRIFKQMQTKPEGRKMLFMYRKSK